MIKLLLHRKSIKWKLVVQAVKMNFLNMILILKNSTKIVKIVKIVKIINIIKNNIIRIYIRIIKTNIIRILINYNYK